MRLFGLVLVALGLLGIVLGVVHMIGIELTDHLFSYATWDGIGPILAGIFLIAAGGYATLSPTRSDRRPLR